MTNRIILFAAAGAFALSTGALARPFNKLPTDGGIVQARTVCDDDGRCWHESDPAGEITDDVLRGLEGRSIHRDRDIDRDRDRDRGRGRERDHWRSGDDDERDDR